MSCEICGSKDENRRARIEGVILGVCNKCVKLGEELPQVNIAPKRIIVKKIDELDFTLREDFSEIIRKEREKRNLTQEQLAKLLREKSTIIKRIEEGWEPTLEITKRLEKFFKIVLTETPSEVKTQRKNKEKLTIGDIVEID
jgi:uncharacterized protein (TIGR00270 family)